MDESHVVVVVRVLAERLPVDRIRLVELTVKPREALEAVTVVPFGERRDPVTKRWSLPGQASEYELVPRDFDSDRDQAVVVLRESVGVHALLVGNPDQAAVDGVRPVVIRAGQRLAAVPGGLRREPRSAVTAVVQEAADGAVGLTDDDHTLVPDPPSEEVARLLQVLGVAQPNPGPGEYADHLELEEILVVDLPRLEHRRLQRRDDQAGRLVEPAFGPLPNPLREPGVVRRPHTGALHVSIVRGYRPGLRHPRATGHAGIPAVRPRRALGRRARRSGPDAAVPACACRRRSAARRRPPSPRRFAIPRAPPTVARAHWCGATRRPPSNPAPRGSTRRAPRAATLPGPATDGGSRRRSGR